MVKFADVTDDGVVDDNDATDIGHVVPQHTGGFNILGNWKSIDFSLGFTYAIGGKVYNANAMHDMMGNKDNMLGANRLDIVSKCWKSYNVDANGNLYQVTDPAELAALNTGAKYALPYSEYGLVSSQFVEDASYLRLQNLTLGYTFPKTWMQSTFLQNLRLREVKARSEQAGEPGYAGRLNSRNIHIASLDVPECSLWAGRRLKELGFSRADGVMVAAIVRGDHRLNVPDGEAMLFPGDRLEVIGDDESLQAFGTRLDAEQFEPTARGTSLQLRRFVVREGTPFVGLTPTLSAGTWAFRSACS